jgi:hypothetical protein
VQGLEEQRKPSLIKTLWVPGSIEWLAEQEKGCQLRPLTPCLNFCQISGDMAQ